jgi:hypothetical protein
MLSDAQRAARPLCCISATWPATIRPALPNPVSRPRAAWRTRIVISCGNAAAA